MVNRKKIFEERATGPLFFYPMFNPSKDLLSKEAIDSFATRLGAKSPLPKKGELYLHIPFCDSFCHMCACYKTHTPRDKSIMDKYIELMKKEIDFYSQTPYVQSLDIECVYFGGGTPSTLSVDLIRHLLSYVVKEFNISSDKEMTFEGDVRTLKSKEKLGALRESGCNRISFGVQTLDLKARKLSGLVPTHDEISECIKNLKEFGYKINFDLMYGLPGQNFDIWKKDLSMAVDMGVEGIDMYETIIYPTTKLFRLRHKLPLANEEERIDMLAYGINYLRENGFMKKSNAIYEKDGNEFRLLKLGHESPDAIAIGDSAMGYLNNFAYRNVSPLPAYFGWSDTLKLPIRLGIELNKEDYYAKRMMVLPRLLKINKHSYENEVAHYRETLNELINKGLLIENDDYISITESGLLWTDNIQYEFIPPKKRRRIWKIMY